MPQKQLSKSSFLGPRFVKRDSLTRNLHAFYFLGLNNSFSLLFKIRGTCLSIANGQKILDSTSFQPWINIQDLSEGLNYFSFFLLLLKYSLLWAVTRWFSPSRFFNPNAAAGPSRFIERDYKFLLTFIYYSVKLVKSSTWWFSLSPFSFSNAAVPSRLFERDFLEEND